VPLFPAVVSGWRVSGGGGAPDVLGGGTGSDRAGAGSFPGRRDGMAGQAGSGRAHSRCQQARKVSFQVIYGLSWGVFNVHHERSHLPG
jgi:hypothetical protein